MLALLLLLELLFVDVDDDGQHQKRKFLLPWWFVHYSTALLYVQYCKKIYLLFVRQQRILRMHEWREQKKKETSLDECQARHGHNFLRLVEQRVKIRHQARVS